MKTNLQINRVSTAASVVAVAAMIAGALLLGDGLSNALQSARGAAEGVLRWYYPALVAFFLGLMAWLGLGRYRTIRLGNEGEAPEYALLPWLSMLFAAGTGVGILFWSVAEPVLHLRYNPFGAGGDRQAAVTAIRLSYFHWALSGWAIFSLVGLCLACFSYRYGRPLTIRSALHRLVGKSIDGLAGSLVDTLAVVATVFGITTTLGMGTEQMAAGIASVAGLEVGTTQKLVIVAGVTLAATASVASGVRRGIRRLSEANVLFGFLLLAFFLFVGPTGYLMALTVQSTGAYLQSLVEMSFHTGAGGEGAWMREWTIFYWGWWIAWSPFVGMFIARISRGRSIREFVMGVLLVPSVFTVFWIGVFGGTALHIETAGQGGIAEIANEDAARALFATIERMDAGQTLTTAAGALAVLLIGVYFVTSADSGTLVITTILSNGATDPPRPLRVVWSVGIGILTATLVVAGGLDVLRSSVVLAAIPFSVITLLMAIGLVQALNAEARGPRQGRKQRRPRQPWAGTDEP